jgi:hypothetical protein
MITHVAGDGTGGAVVVVSDVPDAAAIEKVTAGAAGDDDDTDDSNNDGNRDRGSGDPCRGSGTTPAPAEALRPESLTRKVVRRTLFAIVILVGQVAVSITLKRYGWIERDLNEIFSERFVVPVISGRVMPELQLRLELLDAKMKESIEKARFLAPNFNETLYWLRLNQTHGMESATTQDRLRPGYQLARNHPGVRGKYPVVMIPGFVTSGLEVWKGKDCMEKFFRERVWGGFGSAQFWLTERYCLMENLALDPVMGGDPEGIKLRSAQGFHAADFFVGNDWICTYGLTGILRVSPV